MPAARAPSAGVKPSRTASEHSPIKMAKTRAMSSCFARILASLAAKCFIMAILPRTTITQKIIVLIAMPIQYLTSGDDSPDSTGTSSSIGTRATS